MIMFRRENRGLERLSGWFKVRVIVYIGFEFICFVFLF